MNRYSMDEFIKSTEQQDKGEGFFELETERVLEVNLNGKVWAKAGAMITYNGQIKFEREGILEHGLGKMFKKAFTGEGASLMKADGRGKLYLADAGKKISIIHLGEGESISVNGNDLLSFEEGIDWDIQMMKRITGMMAGGLFNVTCKGPGMIAITSHYEPLTIRVTPDKPVITDPNATVAWSGNLQPDFQTDVSLKSFFGRGSGESVQMKFEGSGFVVVQPFEEVYMQNSQG